MSEIPFDNIDNYYKIGSKPISSGFHGNLYIGQSKKDNKEYAIRVIPNFFLTLKQDFADMVWKIKAIVHY